MHKYIFLLALLLPVISEAQNFRGPNEIIAEISAERRNVSSNKELFELYAKGAEQFTIRGDYELADSLFALSENYIHSETDSTAIIRMMTFRALMYKVQGKFTNSIQDYLWLLDYYRKTNDLSNQVYIYACISEFYRATENSVESEKALQKGIALVNDQTDSSALSYLYSRIAANQNQFKHNMDSTIYYAELGLEWASSEQSALTKSLLLNELAYSYMHKDLNDSTRILGLFQEAIDLCIDNEFYRNLLSAYDNLALYYYRIGNNDRVIEICERSVEMGLSNGWEYALDFSYELLADNLRIKGEYERSNQLYKKAFGIKADNARKNYNKEVAELQAIYEQEVAKSELEGLQEERKKDRYALFGTIAIALVFSGLALFAFLLFRRVRNVNSALIDVQKKTQQTNFELKEVLGEKELLYKELNHRVKNNLTVLSGLIYMQEDLIKEETGKQLYTTLRQRIQAMAMVHEKLYGLTDSTQINFQEYLDELVPLLYSSHLRGKPDFEYIINCESLNLAIDKAIPLALIFNELITNSAKHGTSSQSKNIISIESIYLDDHHRIVYRDSGPGLPKNYDSKKTNSMGTRIIKMMITQLKAKITQNSSKQGLTYIIDIP